MGLSRTPRNKLNMKSLLLVTLLSALVSLSTASITLGKCPVTGANNPDFDPELYLGDWYTAVTNFFPEQAGREISCQRAQYGLLPDGSVSVYNVQTDPDGTFNEICGCGARRALCQFCPRLTGGVRPGRRAVLQQLLGPGDGLRVLHRHLLLRGDPCPPQR